MKFALYDDAECFLDGEYVKKTEAFLANTSILYHDEYIAIWNVTQALDPVILASKLIHEMFHAFQNEQGESRFPDEIDALWNYRYNAEYLSAKLEENRLLADLIQRFSQEQFIRLVALRKWRYAADPYASSYEMAVEQIEGTASYVELAALRQLSGERFLALQDRMTAEILRVETMFPIRIVSYSVGALLFLILKENRLLDFETFSSVPAAFALLEIPAQELSELKAEPEVSAALKRYRQETEEIIAETVERDDCISQGSFELLSLNIYNARRWGKYLVTNSFVQYANGGEIVTLYGDFVLEMEGQRKILRILRADL